MKPHDLNRSTFPQHVLFKIILLCCEASWSHDRLLDLATPPAAHKDGSLWFGPIRLHLLLFIYTYYSLGAPVTAQSQKAVISVQQQHFAQDLWWWQQFWVKGSVPFPCLLPCVSVVCVGFITVNTIKSRASSERVRGLAWHGQIMQI